jgi:glycine/D-amino acid oxidase-like deaminating enzyme
MVVNLYPSTTPDFIRHHGEAGAREYLRLAAEGLDLQKQLAKRFLPAPQRQLHAAGSVYVCEAADLPNLREEFELLSRLAPDSAGLEWLDQTQVQQLHGAAAGFVAGIRFQQDAIIDSPAYAAALLAAATLSPTVRLWEQCPMVTNVTERPALGNGGATKSTQLPPHALVRLANGQKLYANKVVVATGGLFLDHRLAGILRPCWSYLSAIPVAPGVAPTAGPGQCMEAPNSPNFFTYGFTHDWSVTGGLLRVSGEDHFSALKVGCGECLHACVRA